MSKIAVAAVPGGSRTKNRLKKSTCLGTIRHMSVLGPFEGDDVLLERLRSVVAKGSLDAFDSAEQLLAEISALPYTARVAVVSLLASKSTKEGAARMIAAIRQPGKEDSGGGAVTDSEDDEMVIIFASDQPASTNVAYDKRQLALHIAAAAKDSVALLQEVDFPKTSTQDLAFKQACRVVADTEILQRLLQEGQSMNVKNRERMLSSCVQQRRVAVLDQVLPALHSAHVNISQWLHGASAKTVKALLPLCKTPSWKSLWRFHAPVLLEEFRDSLEACKTGCLGRGQLWDKFVGRWTEKFVGELPFDQIFALFLEFPPFRFATGVTAVERTALIRDARSLVPSEHPKKLKMVLPKGFLRIPGRSGGVPSQVSLRTLIATVISLGSELPVHNVNSTLLLQVPAALRQCSPKELPQAFQEVLALLKSFTASAELADVFGGVGAHTQSWELTTACTLITDVLKDQIEANGRRKGRTLSSAQMTQLLAIPRALCEQHKPSCELFGVPSGSASGKMVGLLVAEATVSERLTQWANLLISPCCVAIGPLSHRWMLARQAERDTSGIDAALTAVIEHVRWVSDTIQDANLHEVWAVIEQLPLTLRKDLLDKLVGLLQVLPGYGNKKEQQLLAPWPEDGRLPTVVHAATVKLITEELESIRKWSRDADVKVEAKEMTKRGKEGAKTRRLTYLVKLVKPYRFHLPASLITELLSILETELSCVPQSAMLHRPTELHATAMGEFLGELLLESLGRATKTGDDTQDRPQWQDQQQPLGRDEFERCWRLYCFAWECTTAVPYAQIRASCHPLYSRSQYWEVQLPHARSH
jgi:hypothetical protein